MNTFDEKERREELSNLCEELLTYVDDPNIIINEIISQEKSMIAQAKKEAREDFAERLKNNNFNNDLEVDYLADKLLKEYNDN
jgi:hypothetical protein